MAAKRRKGRIAEQASNQQKDDDKGKKHLSTRCSLCFKLTLVSSLIGIISIAMLPSPIDPVVMDLGGIKCKFYGGNSHLREAIQLFEGQIKGPEGFAVDGDGNMYTGLNDGRIVTFNDTHITTVLHMGPPPYEKCGKISSESHCGRVLGLEISPTDPYLLYICDCYHGIQTLHLKTRDRRVLVNTTSTHHKVPPIKFANDMVVLQNGSIFFTDSSYKFPRNELLMEMYEGRANGKLLHYDPVEDRLSVVIEGLYFPNGVSASRDEGFLVIAETSRGRILKYHLAGPDTGRVEVFADEMPGVPDNISPSASGGFWIGFAFLRTNITSVLGKYPSIRNLIVKLGLARFIAESLPRNGLIMEYDESGNIVRELYDMGGVRIRAVSEILDFDNVLYLGSYEEPFIGKLDLNK